MNLGEWPCWISSVKDTCESCIVFTTITDINLAKLCLTLEYSDSSSVHSWESLSLVWVDEHSKIVCWKVNSPQVHGNHLIIPRECSCLGVTMMPSSPTVRLQFIEINCIHCVPSLINHDKSTVQIDTFTLYVPRCAYVYLTTQLWWDFKALHF